jgi:hypothetical protein
MKEGELLQLRGKISGQEKCTSNSPLLAIPAWKKGRVHTEGNRTVNLRKLDIFRRKNLTASVAYDFFVFVFKNFS